MRYLWCCLVLLNYSLYAQETESKILSFNEYLGYVKKYHPVTKQAELTIDEAQANLMRARGGFDPKIEADYNGKRFKDTEYYDLLNATFKIPTWYGIEFKANFEQNEGVFLNPENSVPDNGLYSAGISVPVARGLLINDRMATLRKAKFFREQVKAEKDILVNEILYQASLAYFNWLKAYNEIKIYEEFLENASIRFAGTKKRASLGDIAAIDTLEASITVQNRKLKLEQARIKFVKSSLVLSNFLWLNDDTPVEIQSNVIPDVNTEKFIDKSLTIQGKEVNDFIVKDHPKLKALNLKIKSLHIDKKLKANRLLPKIDLQYNFLTETPEIANSFNTAAYKGSVRFQIPLFLRKERGDLKMAKIKTQDAQYELENNRYQILNKIRAIYRELESFKEQNLLINTILDDYSTLLFAEERKFSFGESSLFLVNSRERSLINTKLKQIELQNKFFVAKANLFNSLALNPQNL